MDLQIWQKGVASGEKYGVSEVKQIEVTCVNNAENLSKMTTENWLSVLTKGKFTGDLHSAVFIPI